jgi:hypothetical protein
MPGVRFYRLVRPARGKNERPILRIIGRRHVDHEVPTALYHRSLEPLDGAQKIGELRRVLVGAHFNSFL